MTEQHCLCCLLCLSLYRYAREIGDLLKTIPRPLLLLLKTNDCLRCGWAWRVA